MKRIYEYEHLNKRLKEYRIKDGTQEKPEATINFLLQYALMGNDQRTKETIKPEEINFVDLPEYNKVHPK